MWKDVAHPTKPGRLLFRYDPERMLIQIQERGEKHVIDLVEYSKALTESVQNRGLDKAATVG